MKCLPRRTASKRHGHEKIQSLGRKSSHRLDPPARGPLHQGRINHRPNAGFEKSFAERLRIGHANAHVFHQSRRRGPQQNASGSAGKSKVPAVQASAARQGAGFAKRRFLTARNCRGGTGVSHQHESSRQLRLSRQWQARARVSDYLRYAALMGLFRVLAVASCCTRRAVIN